MDAADFAFYRRWIWANGWAELLGLGGSMALGWFGTQALANVGDSPAVVVGSMVAAIVLGTCLEGVLVGYAQARVLRATVPAFAPQPWIVATAVGAAIAWTLGMIPSTIVSLFASPEAGAEPPPIFDSPLQYLLAAGLGLVLGCFLGAPQWRVLRRHAARSGWWVGANALAWAVGMHGWSAPWP
jgi:hypothetical protein